MVIKMKTVITMTSWTKRIQYVGKAIYRFLSSQTVKPDLFYLWLAEEEFPNKEKDLPEDLLLVCKSFNVKICWTKDNEYCFKRWYVYPKHYEDLVISIDDDMFYDIKTIETVINEYKNNPIPAVLHYNGSGGIVKITNGIHYTPTNKKIKISVKNYFMGQCAFTPHSFPLETLEKNIIKIRKNICPKCDESFLHPFLIKNDIPIIFISGLIHKEDSEKQDVAIRNDIHYNPININNKNYTKADLYKFTVLKTIPILKEKWQKEFPNYNFEELT